MRLYYHKDFSGNVGDDLNPWLWPKFFPELFNEVMYHDPKSRQKDGYSGSLFVGIGTLLNEHIPRQNLKAIFGTGTGYGRPPKLENYRIYALRGPLTAKKIGVSEKLAVTDAAVLVRRICNSIDIEKKYAFSFIPHCSTARDETWNQICDAIGVHLILPSLKPEPFIKELLLSDIVITEAMHGAILADALRVPWIPVKTHENILDFKWEDWCLSLDIKYAPYILPSLWKVSGKTNFWGTAKQKIKRKIAYQKLKKVIKSAKPVLSEYTILESKTQKIEEAIERFKQDVSSGQYSNI